MYRVSHNGKEYLFGQLEKVILVKGVAGNSGAAEARALVFKFAPVVFLTDKCDVVD